MKLLLSCTTANRNFVKAVRRLRPAIQVLQQRFEKVAVTDCDHESMLLAFVDHEIEFFRIVSGDKTFFEVEVGYDYDETYPPDDDVLLIQLIEEKLMLALDACEALGEAREKLKALVEAWTTENVDPDSK